MVSSSLGTDFDPLAHLTSAAPFPRSVFFFGNLAHDVPNLRRAHHFGDNQFPPELTETIDAIRSGMFGDSGVFEPLLQTLFEGKDFYLVSDDFQSYLAAQKMVDEAYVDRAGWIEKTSELRRSRAWGREDADTGCIQSTPPLAWASSPATVLWRSTPSPSGTSSLSRSLPPRSFPSLHATCFSSFQFKSVQVKSNLTKVRGRKGSRERTPSKLGPTVARLVVI